MTVRRDGARRRGRPPAVDAAEIGAAVLEIGLPVVTMAAVAQRLGVGQATLYRHAPNRDHLVRLAMDRIATATRWPEPGGSWHTVLEQHALVVWSMLARYPGAATEVARGMLPPSMIMIGDDVGAALQRRGFTAAAAVIACDSVFDLAVDNRRGVEALDRATSGAGRAELLSIWADAPYPDDGYATERERALLRAAMAEAFATDPLEWFRRKLAIVLAGIEHTLAP